MQSSDDLGETVNTVESSHPDLWEKTLTTLKSQFDLHIYSAYIKPLKFLALDYNSSENADSSEISILAPSRLVASHVERKFRADLSKALCDILNVPKVTLKFVVEDNTSTDGSETKRSRKYVVVKKLASPAASQKKPEADVTPHNIIEKYSFSNFVVGNSNQFCHAAASRTADEPGMSYNPLFIYGGVGLGKTHLLHAIGNSVLSRKPNARVLYMSSESFTNELIQALRFAKMDEFKKRLRSIEVLLIDDIQFMCGKDRTQEEFFHTFNTLYGAKHQIVITSDKIPQEIPGLEDRLRTRFSWGLAADLQAPDFETRVAIINRKANLESITLPQEVSHFIADKIFSNVRELEGALTRLLAVSSLQKKAITLELAESVLKPLFQPRKVTVTIDQLKKVVSAECNIKVSEMISKRRTKNLSFPRHIAMYLCRKHTTASYPEIGSQFGGRDHSSVIHAANVVSTKLETDEELKSLVERIEYSLFQQP